MSPSNWSSDTSQAAPIITDRAKCGETGVTYVPGLNRYILVAWYYPTGNGHGCCVSTTCFAFWESPKPWGPWMKIKTVTNNPSGWYCPRVLAKYQAQNGADINAFIACAGNWDDNYRYTDPTNHYYKFATIPITICTTYVAPTPQDVNDADTGSSVCQFAYYGNWASNASRPNAYLQDEHFSNTPGDSFTIKFSGITIDWYASTAPNMGTAAVSIDGGTETLVSLYSSTLAWQVPLYTSPSLSSGMHTLKIRVTNQHDAQSSGFWICNDKVHISPPNGVTALTPVASRLSPAPVNPAVLGIRGRTLTCRLPGNARIVIEAFSLSGKLLFRKFDQAPGPGLYAFALPKSASRQTSIIAVRVNDRCIERLVAIW